MKQVLNGVTLSVRTGEIVALIGHNGAGKSTLLKVVFGLLKTWDGEIFFDGVAPRRPLSPHRLLRSGIAYVPQGNRVFTDLTVYENLEFANFAVRRISRENGIRRALEIFPSLSSRVHQRAATLSGGEKQMLALASVLAVSPRLLLLDEPSLGLDRGSINQAFDRIGRVASDFGTAVLIVEQKVREVLKLANRVYVLRSGAVSYAGSADALANDESELKRVYF
jgi:ABC-type branched-subunit amino acid transport system ATPase component